MNDEWQNVLIRHQVGIQRMGAGIAKRINDLLLATEIDLTLNLERSAHQERIFKYIRDLRGGAWGEAKILFLEEAKQLALYEPEFLTTALERISPVVLDLAKPTGSILRGIVNAKPLQGKVLSQWIDDAQRAELNLMVSQIRIGLAQGESNEVLTRRIVGTSRFKRTDGITHKSRNNVRAIVRTVTNGISNEARQEFYGMNKNLFNEERYVAVLDGRTTTICGSLDGRIFKTGEGVIPPAHFQCRSTRIPIISRDYIGERPFVQGNQRRYLSEFAKMNKLGTIRRRSQLPRGYKSRFDKFARQRKRQLAGRLPARINYEQWLRGQTNEFQNQILGRGRAEIFRRGNLPLSRFTDRTGGEISLGVLRELDEIVS